MVGLDLGGKSTILFRLCRNRDPHPRVDIGGFNVETYWTKGRKESFTIWDISGEDKVRPLWKHYYDGVDGLIFVVDANDHKRMNEACQVLHQVLKDDRVKHTKLLIFANKIDLDDPMPTSQLAKALNLDSLENEYSIQACCGVTGQGLEEGIDWFREVLAPKP